MFWYIRGCCRQCNGVQAEVWQLFKACSDVDMHRNPQTPALQGLHHIFSILSLISHRSSDPSTLPQPGLTEGQSPPITCRRCFKTVLASTPDCRIIRCEVPAPVYSSCQVFHWEKVLKHIQVQATDDQGDKAGHGHCDQCHVPAVHVYHSIACHCVHLTAVSKAHHGTKQHGVNPYYLMSGSTLTIM